MDRKHPNIVNLSQVEPRELSKGSKFGFTSRRLGAAAGGKQLGYEGEKTD